MPLHHHKHRPRAGMPEAIMAIGFLASATFGALWLNARNDETWKRATGSISEGSVETVHYNASDYAARVAVRYAYSVNGVPYIGQWTGLWPSVDSPDALRSDEISIIENEGRTLTVFYHPDNPGRSTLHAAPERDQLYANLAIASFVITFLYAALAYPRWKTARANAPRNVAVAVAE